MTGSLLRTDDPLHVRYQVKENLTITKILMVAGSVQTLLIVSHSVLNLIRRSIPMDMVLYRVLALDGYVCFHQPIQTNSTLSDDQLCQFILHGPTVCHAETPRPFEEADHPE